MQSLIENAPERISAAAALRRIRLFGAQGAVLQTARTTLSTGFRIVSNPANSPLPRNLSSAAPHFDNAEPVHRRFELQAARHPQEIAALCGPDKITYGELNERANRLARYLHRLTASPANLVGIFIEPCVGTMVALLAALKAGRPYIPLDPAAAPRRTAAILAETEALVLLPSESTPACMPARRARAISMESESEIMEYGSAGNLSRSSTTEDLACVVFQTAAEGPKKISISHRACLDTIESLRIALSLTAADRFVATMQPDLALSGLWMLAPLVRGARLILLPRAHEQIGDLLFEQIDRSRAVVLQATPQIARALLDAGWQAPARLKLICGPEPWPGELLKTFDAMGAELWQLHGTIESYELSRTRADWESTAPGAPQDEDPS
jgi:non-ribosomal peptide synthetase component F